MKLPLFGAQFRSVPTQYDPQTCCNWIPIPEQDQADNSKSEGYFIPTPGLTVWSEDSSNQQVRAMFDYNSILYAVIDDTFYTINSSGTRTSRGTLNTSAGRCWITANPTQVAIVDETYMYIYTIATTAFAVNSDVDFVGNVKRLETKDAYGMFVPTDSDDFWLTNLNNYASVSALAVTTPSKFTDTLVAVVPTHDDVFVFGKKKTFVYYNSGAATFPFEVREGTVIDQGATSPYAIIEADNTVFWIASNTTGTANIVRAQGYTPAYISDDTLAEEIRNYTLTDAFALSYTLNGHAFIAFTFPTDDKTWVYDIKTKLWHQMSSSLNNQEDVNIKHRWRANCYCVAFGKQLIGDAYTGKIYELDPDNYTENGTRVLRERITPIVSYNRKQLAIYDWELDCQKGVGLITGQGSDAELMVAWSKDGGATFSNETTLSCGTQGQTQKRVRLGSLGTSRDWCFRIRTSDPCKFILYGLTAHVKGIKPVQGDVNA